MKSTNTAQQFGCTASIGPTAATWTATVGNSSSPEIPYNEQIRYSLCAVRSSFRSHHGKPTALMALFNGRTFLNGCIRGNLEAKAKAKARYPQGQAGTFYNIIKMS